MEKFSSPQSPYESGRRRWRFFSQYFFSLLTSVLIMGLLWALPTSVMFATLDTQVRQALRPTLSVFLRDGEDAATWQKTLAGRAEVAEANLFTKEQAVEQLRKDARLAAGIDALGKNPLPDTVQVTARDIVSPEALSAWRTELMALSGVADVPHPATRWSWAHDAYHLAKIALLMLILALVPALIIWSYLLVRELSAARQFVLRQDALVLGAGWGVAVSLIAIVVAWVAAGAFAPIVERMLMGGGQWHPRFLPALLWLPVVTILAGLWGAWLASSSDSGSDGAPMQKFSPAARP